MDHRLSVIFRCSTDRNDARLLVSGCLTEATQHSLHSVLRQMRMLHPRRIVVDLSKVTHAETGGLGLLRDAAEYQDSGPFSDRVEIVGPEPLAVPGADTLAERPPPGVKAGAATAGQRGAGRGGGGGRPRRSRSARRCAPLRGAWTPRRRRKRVLTVGGTQVLVRSRRRGGILFDHDYECVTGPHLGYEWGVSSSFRPGDEEHRSWIREILAEADGPATGPAEHSTMHQEATT